MARKNRPPEGNAHREKIRELLQMANVGSMDDIQAYLRRPLPNSWRTAWGQNRTTSCDQPQYLLSPPSKKVRRLIYITNAIEGFNRRLRRVTKAKSVFPTDDSLLKILYLTMMDITEKVDWVAAGQEPNPCSDGHLFCRAYARVTQPGTDVQDTMNSSATLDIRTHQRYLVNKAAAGFLGYCPE